MMNDLKFVDVPKAQPKRKSQAKRKSRPKRRVKAPKVIPVEEATTAATLPERQENVSNTTRIQLSSTAKDALNWARSHIELIGINLNKGESSKNDANDKSDELNGDDASTNKNDDDSKKLDDFGNDVKNKCDTTEQHLDAKKNDLDTETCTDTQIHTHSNTVSGSGTDLDIHKKNSVNGGSHSDEDDLTAANTMVDFANCAKQGKENKNDKESVIDKGESRLEVLEKENKDVSKFASDDTSTEDSLTVMIRRANDALIRTIPISERNGKNSGNYCDKGDQDGASNKENEIDDDDDSNDKEDETRDDRQDKDDNQSVGAESITGILERADFALQTAKNLETEQIVGKRQKNASLALIDESLALIDEQEQMAATTNCHINTFETATPSLSDNDTSTSVASKALHQSHISTTTNSTVASEEPPLSHFPLHNDSSQSTHHQSTISQALGSLETLPINPKEYAQDQIWDHDQKQQWQYNHILRWQHEQEQRWQWQRQQENRIRWQNAQALYWQRQNQAQLTGENSVNEIPIELEQREANNATTLDEIKQNQQRVNGKKTLSEGPNSSIVRQEQREEMKTHDLQQKETETEIRQWLMQQQQERIAQQIRNKVSHCSAPITHDMADDENIESSDKESEHQTQQQHQDIDHTDAHAEKRLELASEKHDQHRPSDEIANQIVNSEMPLSPSNNENIERVETEQERQIVNSMMPPSQSDDANIERERTKKIKERAQQQKGGDNLDGHVELASNEEGQDKQHPSNGKEKGIMNSKMLQSQSDDKNTEKAEEEQNRHFRENDKELEERAQHQQDDVDGDIELATKEQDRHPSDQEANQIVNSIKPLSQSDDENIETADIEERQFRENEKNHPIYIYRITKSFLNQRIEQVEQNLEIRTGVELQTNDPDKDRNSTFNGSKKRKLGADNSTGIKHNLRPRRSLRSTQRFISRASEKRVILNNTPVLDLEANLEASLSKSKSPQSSESPSNKKNHGQKRKNPVTRDDSQERSRSNIKSVSQNRVGKSLCVHTEKQAVVDHTHIDSTPFARCWNSSCRTERSLSDLMRCTQCEKALYCNQNCQIVHWESQHSKTCKPPKVRALDGSKQLGNGLNASPADNSQTERFPNDAESNEVTIQDTHPITITTPAPPTITMDQVQTLIDRKMVETERTLKVQAVEQRKLFDEQLKETVLKMKRQAEKERNILDKELKKKDASVHKLQLQVEKQSEDVGKMIDEKINKTVDCLQRQVREDKIAIEQKLKEKDATIHTLQLQVDKQAEEGRKLLDQRIKETILTLQLQSEDERAILDNKLKERDSTIRTLQLQVEKLEKDMRRSFGQGKHLDDHA